MPCDYGVGWHGETLHAMSCGKYMGMSTCGKYGIWDYVMWSMANISVRGFDIIHGVFFFFFGSKNGYVGWRIFKSFLALFYLEWDNYLFMFLKMWNTIKPQLYPFIFFNSWYLLYDFSIISKKVQDKLVSNHVCIKAILITDQVRQNWYGWVCISIILLISDKKTWRKFEEQHL